MGIFKRVLNKSDANRQRRRAQADTSPKSTVELCRLLQRQGKVKLARDVAQEGLSRFPNSLELREILHSTWQRSGRQKIKDLEAKLEQDPTVENYLALVDYCVGFDEIDRAGELCQSMIELHPDSAEASLASGKVMLSRFHRDHVAQDGAHGLKSLQRAAELQPANFDVHFTLAEAYYYIGAISKALFHLYRAMDIEPDHPEATKLYRILVRLPLEKQEEAELLREVEENDDSPYAGSLSEIEAYSVGDSELSVPTIDPAKGLEQLSHLADVRRVVLSLRDREMVARDGQLLRDEDDERRDLVLLAMAFRRTASLSAKRMGIGAFEEVELSWGEGHFLALAAGRTILLIETGPTIRLSVVAAEARNFLAGCTVIARKESVNA